MNVFEEIEDPLAKEAQGGWRTIVMWGGVVVYVMVLGLTLAHNYNLIVNAVAQNVRWIAIVGVAALELNAIILPLAIHHWTTTSWHRALAIIFYVFDLAILFANSLIDARMVTGGVESLTPVALWYLDNFAQASPLYSLVVWSVLWMADPASRAKEKMNKMIAHAQLAAIEQVNGYLKSPDFQKVVKTQGNQIGKYVIGKAFTGQMFDDTEQPEPIQEIRSKSNGNGNFH